MLLKECKAEKEVDPTRPTDWTWPGLSEKEAAEAGDGE